MFGEECFLVLAGMGVASWLVLLDPGCFVEVCWEDYVILFRQPRRAAQLL